MNIEESFYIQAEILSIRRKSLTMNHSAVFTTRKNNGSPIFYLRICICSNILQINFFSFTFWFQFCCRSSTLFETLTLTSLSGGGEVHLSCDYPQYIFLAGVLSFISVSVFLKLAAGIKFLLMASMLAIYIVVMEITHWRIFESFDNHQK